MAFAQHRGWLPRVPSTSCGKDFCTSKPQCSICLTEAANVNPVELRAPDGSLSGKVYRFDPVTPAISGGAGSALVNDYCSGPQGHPCIYICKQCLGQWASRNATCPYDRLALRDEYRGESAREREQASVRARSREDAAPERDVARRVVQRGVEGGAVGGNIVEGPRFLRLVQPDRVLSSGAERDWENFVNDERGVLRIGGGVGVLLAKLRGAYSRLLPLYWGAQNRQFGVRDWFSSFNFFVCLRKINLNSELDDGLRMNVVLFSFALNFVLPGPETSRVVQELSIDRSYALEINFLGALQSGSRRFQVRLLHNGVVTGMRGDGWVFRNGFIRDKLVIAWRGVIRYHTAMREQLLMHARILQTIKAHAWRVMGSDYRGEAICRRFDECLQMLDNGQVSDVQAFPRRTLNTLFGDYDNGG